MARAKVTYEIDEQLRRAIKRAAVNSGLREYEIVDRALRAYLGWDIMDRLRDRAPQLSEEEAMRLAYEELHAVRADRR